MRGARIAEVAVVLCAACAAPAPPGSDDGPAFPTAAEDAADSVDLPDPPPLPLCDEGIAAPPDPGVSAAGWLATGGSVVESDGVAALFGADAICAETAALTTTLAMPACFMPLALRWRIEFEPSPFNDPILPASGISFGASSLDLAPSRSDREAGRCIGERAFGGLRELTLKPRAFRCEDVVGEIADVALVSEPGCPAPGEVVPFAQWTAGDVDGFYGASASILRDKIELVTGGECDAPWASGPEHGAVSFPDDDGVALRVVVEGDPQRPIQRASFAGLLVSIGGRLLRHLAVGENIVCVPHVLRGTTQRLTFTLDSGSGQCAEPYAQYARIAQPTVVSGVCDDVALVNGTFDEGDVAWIETDGGASPRRDDLVEFYNSAVRLANLLECDDAQILAAVAVPFATEHAGPTALIRYTKDGLARAFAQVRETGDVVELPSTNGGIDDAVLCLPKSRAGELVELSLHVSDNYDDSGGGCDDPTDTPSTLLIEQVRVVLDAKCAGD